MELAADVIDWFELVPVFNGNRDLPPEHRLSLEVKNLSQLDLMNQRGWEREGRMETWRDQILKPQWGSDGVIWPQIMELSPEMLRGVRQFIAYTRSFKNFVFNGQEVTDPIRIAVRLMAGSNDLENGLFVEINGALNKAVNLSGDALKNFVAQCGGLAPPTNTAPPAPEDAAPQPAATPEDAIPS